MQMFEKNKFFLHESAEIEKINYSDLEPLSFWTFSRKNLGVTLSPRNEKSLETPQLGRMEIFGMKCHYKLQLWYLGELL